MHEPKTLPAGDKRAAYTALAGELEALLAGEHDLIACAANAAALLYWSLPKLNWAGFYLFDEAAGELRVGPFQGKPACVRIAMGRGVCGTAAATRKTVIVADVHEFPGHIACDAASNSEIVVPLVLEDRLIGVLDLDSPVPGRFEAEDARGLEEFVRIFLQAVRTRDDPRDRRL